MIFPVIALLGTASAAVLPVTSFVSTSVPTTIPNTFGLKLQNAPACISVQSAIQFAWNASAGNGKLDWLGIYPIGQCDKAAGGACPKSSSAWAYLDKNGGDKGRVLTLAAPATGTFVAYYLLNDGYTIGALSESFVVQALCSPVASHTLTLKSSQTCVQAGAPVQFGWTSTDGNGAKDWVGMYPVGKCGTQIGDVCTSGSSAWGYIFPNGGSTGGNITINAPTATGSYGAYYLLNDAYTIAALTPLFEVKTRCPNPGTPATSAVILASETNSIITGGFMKFSWKGANESVSDDWIVFTTGDAPTESNIIEGSWQYTYGGATKLSKATTATGSVYIKVPAALGRYTAFYCLGNGFNCPSSATVAVTAPQVTCRANGGTASPIKHVITILSENHSFNSYFGRYCKAAPGSKPTCNNGPDCCEGVPSTLDGQNAFLLDDNFNLAFDPCHSYSCEVCEITNNMQGFFTGCSGSNPKNFAMADGSSQSASKYWQWASQYAMSDRHFQSAVGASSQNDMYFARGAFVFLDNQYVPNLPASAACYSGNLKDYSEPTIADLLTQCDVSFTFYAQGYSVPPKAGQCYPNYYDPSDNPFAYYPSLTNSTKSAQLFRDADNDFFNDVAAGNLPAVSFFKSLGTNCEHPGISSISAGEEFNQKIIDAIMNHPVYKDNTIIILTPDESGGYHDTVTPPGVSPIDNMPYGPRTPFVVIGGPAKKNYVSHVPIEPASIIRFIESNWLDGTPGQLHTRDAVVNNLGDLLNVAYAFP
ncbi:hypothetical protein HDU79_011210 [Rhizoclosmatium sp. JEL0117]|nr:hypothetical protein HDU79_011210 [Rhizoclosmatium sp. JEL0117]